MTTANWITVVLSLVGIVANLGWFMLTRFFRTQDELKHALTGDNGAVARIHQRIDKLGDVYQTRKETEMQFEYLRQFMDQWKLDSERRHGENLKRFEDLKDQQKVDADSVKVDVRSLRQHVDDMRKGDLRQTRSG
jgi:hypothetical protein